MSHKDEIKAKIREIQKRMAEDESQKLELEIQLNRLQLAEFEEDMKETQNQQFLKG
jgi:predicted  nucleic acid-binding Zn-ribbon protein